MIQTAYIVRCEHSGEDAGPGEVYPSREAAYAAAEEHSRGNPSGRYEVYAKEVMPDVPWSTQPAPLVYVVLMEHSRCGPVVEGVFTTRGAAEAQANHLEKTDRKSWCTVYPRGLEGMEMPRAATLPAVFVVIWYSHIGGGPSIVEGVFPSLEGAKAFLQGKTLKGYTVERWIDNTGEVVWSDEG